MKTHFVVAITAIMLMTTMISSMPSVTAQSTTNAHANTVLPLSGLPGTFYQMSSTTAGTPDDLDGATDGPDIYLFPIFSYIDTDFGGLAVSTNPTVCAQLKPIPADLMWRLTFNNLPLGIVYNDVELSPQSAIIDGTGGPGVDGFGTGDFVTSSLTGGATYVSGPLNAATVGGFVIVNPGAGTITWELVNSAGTVVGTPDSTSTSGQGLLVACNWVDGPDGGQTGGLENGIWQIGVEVVAESAEGFLIQRIVGGVVSQIETVPLLVAGVETNALWILPILGLAGTIIAIRKLEA